MRQSSVPLVLASSSVNNGCFESVSFKLFSCAISSVACSGKHNCLSSPSNQIYRDFDTLVSVDGPEMMLEAPNVRCFWSDFVTNRIGFSKI